MNTESPFNIRDKSKEYYGVRINEDNLGHYNYNTSADKINNSTLFDAPNELDDGIITDCTINKNELLLDKEPCDGDLQHQRLEPELQMNKLISNIIDTPCMQSCSKTIPDSENFSPTVRFANNCGERLKQQYLSRDHIMANQTVEVKTYAEKTTYCRPTLNIYGQQDLQKIMQREARLRTLVRKLVLAQQMEKQELWNNYVNMLKNKHRYNSPQQISHHNVADDYDRSKYIDDYCNTNLLFRESDLINQHLLQHFYGVLGKTQLISNNNYPSYFNNMSHLQYMTHLYENYPYCYPISSQGRLIMLQREKQKQRQGFAYNLKPKLPGRFFRNDTIIADTENTRRRNRKRKSNTRTESIAQVEKKRMSGTKSEWKPMRKSITNLETKTKIQPETTSNTAAVRKSSRASLILPQTTPLSYFKRQSEKIPELKADIEPEIASIIGAVRKSTRASSLTSQPASLLKPERQSKAFETIPETKISKIQPVITPKMASEPISITTSVEPEIKPQFKPELKSQAHSVLACKCSPSDAILYCTHKSGSNSDSPGIQEHLQTRTRPCCNIGLQSCPAVIVLRPNDELAKVSSNISRLKDKIERSDEKQQQRILSSIEEKIDNLTKSINQFISEIKAKDVVGMISKSTSICECIDGDYNFNNLSSCESEAVTDKQVFYSMGRHNTRSEFSYSNVDTQIQNENISKILHEEMDKSNKIKKDIESMLKLRNDRPCSVHITFDIPTKERSTEVTNSLCKAKVDTNTTVEKTSHSVASTSENHMTLAVNTDPLGLSALLKVSAETVKQILLYMPNIDYYSYLSLLQLPQLSSTQPVSHYICNICGAAFGRPSQLSDHIQEHNLGNTRDCRVCRHAMDMRHRRTGLYTCQYCGQRFTRAYCCELHQQSCARRFGRQHDVASSLMLLK